MKHLHRNVLVSAALGLAIVASAYALLGIGFAVIVAVGLFAVAAFVLVGIVVFEEESRLPSWREAQNPGRDHGYHPTR
jgi:uncharacterized membrane protein